MSSIEELIKWFLDSEIFDGKAYVAYYAGKRRGPVYPEITAYAISLSCILFKRSGKQKFLERAKKLAEYMTSVIEHGAVPNFSDNLMYTFDTGIFISAVFDLYEITRNNAYLEQAKKSLNWLYTLWDGNKFFAVDPRFMDNKWYRVQSAHLVKLAIPLFKAAEYLNEPKHLATAIKLLQAYKPLQEKDGRFRINQDAVITLTHPHCYATEGYLYAYYKTGNKEFLEIAHKAGEWLCKVQNPDGSLYRTYSPQGKKGTCQAQEKLKTSDATAQATRIWKLLGISKSSIERAYNYLNSELDGGLHLLRNESLVHRLLSWRRPVYSWPTFFFIHSLMLPFGGMDYAGELF
ncbi:MAG: hypothetical protein QXH37_08120 [Candidatus Bathyarchaeia archaeon]